MANQPNYMFRIKYVPIDLDDRNNPWESEELFLYKVVNQKIRSEKKYHDTPASNETMLKND